MTVHLAKRKGIYHAVISYQDETKKWRQKAQTTNLKVKGNKKEAEKIADEFLEKFEKEYNNRNFNVDANILFSDFLFTWLETKKINVRPNTLHAYTLNVNTHIAPYFKDRNIKLCDLNQRHLQAFINKKLEVLSPNTVLKLHQHIYSALKHALQFDLIQCNWAERVELPHKVKPTPMFYSTKELQNLLEVANGTPVESAVYLTVHYGLRREEVLGLKYSAIDFDKNTIEINHTAVLVGSKVTYIDKTKTSASKRTLPLMDDVKEYLEAMKKVQEKDKGIFGDSYFVSDYVCKNPDGTLIKPTYLTQNFNKLLKKNGLKHMRFHDIRHSFASLMLRSGCSLKETQVWLGHEDISTTGNVYAHLLFEEKVKASSMIESSLNFFE